MLYTTHAKDRNICIMVKYANLRQSDLPFNSSAGCCVCYTTVLTYLLTHKCAKILYWSWDWWSQMSKGILTANFISKVTSTEPHCINSQFNTVATRS